MIGVKSYFDLHGKCLMQIELMIASYFPLLLWKCNVNILMHAYLNFQGNLQIDLNKLQICSHALCSIWTNCIHYICGSWEHFSNVKLKIQIVAQPWPWGVVWTNFYTTLNLQTTDTRHTMDRLGTEKLKMAWKWTTKREINQVWIENSTRYYLKGTLTKK